MHDTYLNGARHGWPQIPEDAFDLPALVREPGKFNPATDVNPIRAEGEYAGRYLKPGPDYGFNILSEAFERPATLTADEREVLTADAAIAAKALTGAQGDALMLKSFEDKPDPMAEYEYRAEFGDRGEAYLLLYASLTTQTATRVGSFDTFADAQKAAIALNEHCGY